MSWLNNFRPGHTPAQPAQTVQVVAAAPADPAEVKKEPTLDSQAELFKPADTDYKAPDFDPSQLFKVDPAEMQAALGKLNFMDGITNEQLQTIQAGGDGATQALLAIVNQTGQKALGMSMQTTQKMIESALAKSVSSVDQRFEHLNKTERFTAAIKEANPALASQGAAFMVESLRDAMMKKFPNATTAEIKDKVGEFMTQFTKTAAPVQQTTKNGRQDDTDWGSFLDPDDIEARHY